MAYPEKYHLIEKSVFMVQELITGLVSTSSNVSVIIPNLKQSF